MKYKVEILPKDDKKIYIKLLENDVKNKTFFHRIEWLDLLERYYNRFYKVNLVFYLIIDKSGDVAAILPAYDIKRIIIRILASPLEGWSTPYLGPVIIKNDIKIEDIIKEFLKTEVLKGSKYDYFEISFFYQIKEESFYESFESSCNFEKRKTLLCRLYDSEETMWKMISGRARNMVRKAKKNGVSVIIQEDKKWIEDYYNMLNDVYAKSDRLPPLGKEFFYMLSETLDSESVKIFFAYFKDRPIAGAIFLLNDYIAYYWNGASYKEYNSLGANNLIQWEFIKFAIKNGIKIYDLVGYGHEGIARFKKSLNPQEHSYTYFYTTPTLKGKIGRKVYKISIPYIRRIKKYFYR